MSDQSTAAIASRIRLRLLSGPITKIDAGSFQFINVEVWNEADLPFVFPAETPVNLSYRWYTTDGQVLVPEGLRSSLKGALAPGERRAVPLRITAPDTRGHSILRISLVFEMHFWFFNQFDTGWLDYKVLVTDDAEWPEGFDTSRAAKALRGAITRDRFKSRLAGTAFHAVHVPAAPKAETLQTAAIEAPAETPARFPEFTPLDAGKPFSYELWSPPAPHSSARLESAHAFAERMAPVEPVPSGRRERWLVKIAKLADRVLAMTGFGAQLQHSAQRTDELAIAFTQLTSHLDDRLDAIQNTATQRQVWNAQALRETLRGIRQLSDQNVRIAEETDRRRTALSTSLASAFADVGTLQTQLSVQLDGISAQLGTMHLAVAQGFSDDQEQFKQLTQYCRSLLDQLRTVQLAHLSLARDISAARAATAILPDIAERIESLLTAIDQLRGAGDDRANQLRTRMELIAEQVSQHFIAGLAEESERTKMLIVGLDDALGRIEREMEATVARAALAEAAMRDDTADRNLRLEALAERLGGELAAGFKDSSARTIALIDGVANTLGRIESGVETTASRATAIEASIDEQAARNIDGLKMLGNRLAGEFVASAKGGGERTQTLLAAVQDAVRGIVSEVQASAARAEELEALRQQPVGIAHIDALRSVLDTASIKIARIDEAIPLLSGEIDKLGLLPKTVDAVGAAVTRIDETLPSMSGKIDKLGPLPEAIEAIEAMGIRIARMDETLPFMSGKIDKLGLLPQTVDAMGAAVTRMDETLPSMSGKIDKLGLLQDAVDAMDGKVLGVREILPFMSGKIDHLLHRQVFAVPELGVVFCRNACGIFGVPDTDAEAIAYFASGQIPEPGSVALAQSLLPPGGTLVDVGANLGLFTVAGARKVGPGGSVIAVEPSAETLQALQLNVTVNGIEAIAKLHNIAAGRKADRRLLHLGRTSGLHSLAPVPGYGDTTEVDVQPLDDIVGDRAIDLLKIDVEGWELEVLSGAPRLLKTNPNMPIIIEFGPSHLVNTGTSVKEWFDMIAKLGYMWHAIEEHSGDVHPFDPGKANEIHTVNLLLSRTAPQNLARYG